MTCTFFGHSHIFEDIKPSLTAAITDLIENRGVTRFYVGTHGAFDDMCFKVLSELSAQYPGIDYAKVLARVPGGKRTDIADYTKTVVPEGLENAHPKYRINYRNNWMINKSQFVITYIVNPFGTGAAQYARKAEKAGKTVIKLGKE